MAAKPTKGNSTNTDGGTEISFQNTPQAKDDDFGSGAQRLDVASTTYLLDVMGNDLGGNGKSLWSVDDGVNQSGAMSGQQPGDLLTQDLAGQTGLPANRSLFGASLSVTADGKVTYDTSTIDAAIALNLKKLALGETMADSFIYAIRLGSGTLSWAKANVTLTGVNDTPTVAAVTAVTTEDAPVNGTFLGDDIDNDDDINSLVYNIVGTPAAGEIVNNNDGSFTFKPNSDFQSLAVGDIATILLNYTATDRHGATSAPGSLQITINGVNDVPTMASAAAGANEDGVAVTVDLSALGADIDQDDDGVSLVYTLLNQAPAGSASISGTTFTFNPGADFQQLAIGQTQTFDLQVQAKDKHGATAENIITVTVTGVNDAPTLSAGAVGATEDGAAVAVDLSALGNDIDSDNDGTNLVYSLLNAAPAGQASISGTTLNFATGSDFQALAAGQTQTFDLQVQAKDVHGATADNIVSVTVTGVNDAPTLSAGAVGATEDGAAVAVDLSALGNDIDSDDDGNSLTYSLLNAAPAGQASISGTTLNFATGSDFQALAAGQTQTFDLQVQAKDVHGATADNIVSVTVTGVNDAPTLATAALSVSEDGAASSVDLHALGNDIDSDDTGASLAYSIAAAPSEGIASIAGGALSFSPGNAFQYLGAGVTKEVVFSVAAKDSHNAVATTSFTATVTGVNDAPVVGSGSDGTGAVTAVPASAPFKVEQWTGYVHSHNDYNPATSYATLSSYAANNQPNYTAFSKIIDYTDDSNGFAGDLPGGSPWPAAVATGATSTSAAVNDNFFARITGQINITTADTYTFRTYSDDGVYLHVNNQSLISDHTYHGETARESSIYLTPGVYPIELFFFEGGGEASLEFSFKNSGGAYQHVNLESTLRDTGIISFSDVDLVDSHSVSVAASGATLGSLTAVKVADTTGTGTGGQIKWDYAVSNDDVRYLPSGATKVETFTVAVDDGKGGMASQQVAVTITGINDPAVLGNAVASLTETDAVLTTGGTLSISDVDTGEALFNVQSNVAGNYGKFSINASGAWSYTTNSALDELDEAQLVTDIFNVTSVDGTATTVTVNITGTADGPTAVDDSNALTASTVETNTSNHVYWVDWTSITPIPNNAYGEVNIAGTITLPDRTIGVTYTGQIYSNQTFIDPGNQTNYWRSYNGSQWLQGGDGVYTSAAVANGPGDTNFDFIALALASTPRNLSFSEPVANLFFAVASMNNNGYLFDQPFTVVSSAEGPNDRGNWGYTAGITLSANNGQYGISTAGYSPNEFHGVLAINNAVDSLTWVSQSVEYWQGFTVGTYGVAQSATASGNVLANDDKGGVTSTISVSDVGGQAMVGNSVTLNLASGAILKVDKDGDYLYDDNGAFAHLPGGVTAVDSVVYTVADNKGYSDTATLSITITGVNDAAELGSATVNLVETDAVLAASGQLSITDLDDGEAHFNAQSNVAGTYGSFSIDAAGNWNYTTSSALDQLNAGDNVTDVFAVTSADGTATSVTINIAGTADGPTANNDSNSLSASTVVPNTSNTVYWVDWRSVTITGPRVGNATSGDAPVHVEGVITLGDGHEIGVTYDGLAFIVQANEQKYVYTGSNLNEYEWTQPGLPNDPAYISSQVNAAPATKDIIGLNEAFIGGGFQNASGTRTDFSPRNLTFSEPVENLFFAVVSMNSNGYKFDESFQIVSQGPGKYGDSSTISPTNFGNGQWGIVSGGEFNAVLKIDGSVDHLTWTSQNKETWNGFTVGTYGQAQTATATGNLLANDVADASAPTLSVSSAGGQAMVGNSVTLSLTNGATLKVDRDGNYFFDDNGGFASLGAGQSHVENISYTVKDNQGQTDTALLSITINGVNDAAVLGSANVTVQEEEGLIRTQGTLSISDVDTGEALFTVQNSTQGTYGTFTIRENGNWIYLSDTNLDFLKQDEVVSDTFNVTSVDGTSTTVTVNIVGTSQTFVAPGNLITNGSFETGLAPWVAFSGGVDRVSDSLWDAADGTYSIDLNAFSEGGIRQDISTQDGTTYGVFFQLSKNYDGSGTVPSVIMTVEEEGGSDQSYSFSESNSPTNMLWRGETFVFIADTGANTTTLSFVSNTAGAKGAAIDDVVALANTLISGFDKADGDVLDLHSLLLSITAPTDNTAFSGGYLKFLQNGSDTLVQVDPNGGGDDYLTAVTLVGVNLAQSDTDNYSL